MPRLYHFYFEGVPDPVTIQAEFSQRAREMLQEIRNRLPAIYKDKDVIDETTEALITDVTTRSMNGKKCVWTGRGWRPVP